jgi:hypothetical protein
VGQIYFGDQAGKWVRFKSALIIMPSMQCDMVACGRAHSDIHAVLVLGRLEQQALDAGLHGVEHRLVLHSQVVPHSTE